MSYERQMCVIRCHLVYKSNILIFAFKTNMHTMKRKW